MMSSEEYQRQLKNINVFVRIRPFQSTFFADSSCLNIINQTQLSIKSKDQIQKNCFAFDRVFTPETTQKDVYDSVARGIVEKSFEGINGTIFCYGQTSSGKTYTCLGSNFKDEEKKGILPRIIKQTLQRMKEKKKNVQYSLKISMIEIYNEKIIDLFSEQKRDLKIRENKNQGIFVAEATEKYIVSEKEALLLILKGISSRSVASTIFNKVSSRSHLIFLLTIHQHDYKNGQGKFSKITLADLAGSERLSKSGSEGKILEESRKINTSLSTLGKVIHVLSEGKKTHIPYRESKLTRLLQQSLGGNSITHLIINIAPSSLNETETLMSLRFGHRAKLIKNGPRINKEYTVPQLLDLLSKAEKRIKEQNQAINELKKNTSFRHLEEFSNLSLIVKQQQDSSDQQCKKIPENFTYLEEDYKINQSTQSLEDWDVKQPLKSSFNAKRCLDHYFSQNFASSIDLRSKTSLKEINLEEIQSTENFWTKSLSIQSKVYSLDICHQKKEIKKDYIDQNLERIRNNLKMIKEKHMKIKENDVITYN